MEKTEVREMIEEGGKEHYGRSFINEIYGKVKSSSMATDQMLSYHANAIVIEGMKEKFPSIDSKEAGEIVDFLFGFCEENTSNISEVHYAAEKMIEKSLTKSEVSFLEVVLDNSLESGTKDGVTIIKFDDYIEVRNNGSTKIIEGEDLQPFEDLFLDEDPFNTLEGQPVLKMTGPRGNTETMKITGDVTFADSLSSEATEKAVKCEMKNGSFMVGENE